MINKKEYPLILLKEVQKLYQEIRNFANDNDDYIKIDKNDEFEIGLIDSIDDSDFSFTISNPRYDNSKVIFDITYNPKNSILLSTVKASTYYQGVINNLNQWFNLLVEYNKISLSPEQKILNDYEEEFYSEFEIIDDDADTKPYDLKTQIVINNFLVYTIEILEKDKVENRLLIDQAEKLKEELPKLTMKTTVKRLSKLFAAVRQKSLPLLQQIFELGKKELFKKAINGGFDFILNLIH